MQMETFCAGCCLSFWIVVGNILPSGFSSVTWSTLCHRQSIYLGVYENLGSCSQCLHLCCHLYCSGCVCQSGCSGHNGMPWTWNTHGNCGYCCLDGSYACSLQYGSKAHSCTMHLFRSGIKLWLCSYTWAWWLWFQGLWFISNYNLKLPHT